MSKKKEKQSSDEATEKEDELDKLIGIRDWIKQNPAEFTIDGKPVNLTKENEPRLRFRLRILDRCKQYKKAPDEYLKTMLKTLPEIFKWYFNVFQTVFIAGLVGLWASAFYFTCSSFFTWASKTTWALPSSFNNFLSLASASISDWIGWVLSGLFVIIVLFLALISNKKTGSSWLSHIIQHWFKIVHNLTELKIEMYYISKIIEMREAEKRQTTVKTT